MSIGGDERAPEVAQLDGKETCAGWDAQREVAFRRHGPRDFEGIPGLERFAPHDDRTSGQSGGQRAGEFEVGSERHPRRA